MIPLLPLLLACAPDPAPLPDTGEISVAIDDTDPGISWDTAAQPDDDTGDSSPPDDTEPDDTGDTAADTGDTGEPAPDPSCVERPAPAFDPDTTVTIVVGGWELDGATTTGVYGEDSGGGDIADGVLPFLDLPEGRSEPSAPNQLVGVEYYGDEPPDYYTDADIKEVEALEGVPRYGLIVGKYVRHVLERAPEATAVNLTCHSMGCEVSRYVLENDVEGLASEGWFARWVTFAGVIGGAGLADAFDDLSDLADLIGIDLIDVQHMVYDWYSANVAACDNERLAGNNPTFGGMVIHHILATQPTLDKAYGLPVLDLYNPDSLPNDAIVWTDDEYFHEMADDARIETLDGELLRSSRSWYHQDHFVVRETQGAHAVASAALTSGRRVEVKITEITLYDDHEKDDAWDFSEDGDVPAEVTAELTVWWPYLLETWGVEPIVNERAISYRSADLTEMEQSATAAVEWELFSAPVFDEMETISLHLDLLEADWYPTYDVDEAWWDVEDRLGEVWLDVPLEDAVWYEDLGDAEVQIEVTVHELY